VKMKRKNTRNKRIANFSFCLIRGVSCCCCKVKRQVKEPLRIASGR
jgi:hypothetical protein